MRRAVSLTRSVSAIAVSRSQLGLGHVLRRTCHVKMSVKKCDVEGCSNTSQENIMFFTLPADRSGHSKWLHRTFGDIGVTDPMCQTVCAQHADPQFLRIIKLTYQPVADNSSKSVDPSPGPSGIKNSNPKIDPLPRQKPGRKKGFKKVMNEIPMPALEVTQWPEPLKAVYTSRTRKRPKAMTDEGVIKRASFDVCVKSELSDDNTEVTSEIIIKDDPGSFEAELLPSILCDIPVKQEPLAPEEELTRDLLEEERCSVVDIKEEVNTSSVSENTNIDENISAKTNNDIVLETKQISHDAISEHSNKADFQSVNEILEDLEQKDLISATEKSALGQHNLQCSVLNTSRFSPQTMHSHLQAFAITLYMFSHRAYEYARDHYNTNLPPSSTLREWLVKSRSHSGFTRETLEAINAKANAVKQQKFKKGDTYNIFVSLDLKEIKITPSKRYHGNKPRGSIINPLDWWIFTADAVLVLSAVALNASWKLPIGYFWTNVVKASERANLVRVAINILEDVGVQPVALTFEYNNENIQMCADLGCFIDNKDFKTSFFSESSEQIFLFPELCGILDGMFKDVKHMDCFVAEELETVYSVYITQLLLLVENFPDSKSAQPEQLLKKVIASEMWKTSTYPGIAPGTVKFLKNVRVLLDVLSCRKGGLNLKQAISNVTDVTTNPAVVALQEAGKFFRSLRLRNSNQPLRATVMGRGILGLCSLIDSALMMICNHFHYSNKFPLQFGKFIGSNYYLANLTPQGQGKKNPSAYYFQNQYKGILYAYSNTDKLCENISLLECGSPVVRINLTTKLPNDNNTWHIHDDLHRLLLRGVTEYTDMVVVYIARFVTYSLVRQLQCEICIRALRPEKKRFVNVLKIANSIATKLEEPSVAVLDICKTAEAAFNKAVKHSYGKVDTAISIPKFSVQFILFKVMKKYVNRPMFDSIAQHQFDTDPTYNHVVELTKAVAELYLETRIHHYGTKYGIPKKK